MKQNSTQRLACELRAIAALHCCSASRNALHNLREAIASKEGCGKGPNRFPISGGICEHWSEQAKQNVLLLVNEAQTQLERSFDLWKLSGRRRETWLAKKEETLGQGTTTF